jgi:hypothetical protein
MWNSLPDCFLERLGTALSAYENRYGRTSDVASARLACKAWAAAVTSGKRRMLLVGPGPRDWGNRLFSRVDDPDSDADSGADSGANRLGSIESLHWCKAPSGPAFADAPLAGLVSYTSTSPNTEDNLVTMAAMCRRLASLQIYGRSQFIRNESLAVIATISTLTRLQISSALITDVSALDSLVTLGELYLCSCEHLETGVEALGRMTALTTIDLSGTKVPPSDLVHLVNATSLSYLNVGDTVSAQFSDFCLPRLASLKLARVDVTGESHIPSLTSLSLRTCTTSPATKESLGRMTTLTRLEVRDSHDFEDAGLLLMPLSITDLVVPNFQLLGIRRLTNLVSLDVMKNRNRMNPWRLSHIANNMPPGLRFLTLSYWTADEWDEAIEAALTLPGLTSLSIVQDNFHPTYLSADALRSLAAATHLTSVTAYGKAVARS